MNKLQRLPGIAIAVLCATAAVAAPPTAKKRTGPSVEELQEKIIELQGQLLACQGAAKASSPSPTKNAAEAFQTFNSTIEAGINYSRYKDALIALKVKVDHLPDGDAAVPMKQTLLLFVDAGNLWNISITGASDANGLFVPTDAIADFLSKYNTEWSAIRGSIDRTFNGYSTDKCGFVGRSPNGLSDVAASCVKDLASVLIAKGQVQIPQLLGGATK
jgi:hypothetical protein